MTYAAFNYLKPDPANDNGTEIFTFVRENELALRDALVLGLMPGWKVEPKNSAETGPPADYAAIPRFIYSKGVEQIRETVTYTSGYPATSLYEYSATSGSSYETIGTETYTWDAGHNFATIAWS